MTIRLERAIDAVRRLSEERQDEIAEGLEIAAQAAHHTYTEEQIGKIRQGIADADAGRFVTEEELSESLARILRRA